VEKKKKKGVILRNFVGMGEDAKKLEDLQGVLHNLIPEITSSLLNLGRQLLKLKTVEKVVKNEDASILLIDTKQVQKDQLTGTI
jgi:hypothetical protein